jgi:hypothetical protein
MPLRHNIITQRQAQSRAFTRGFGGEKRLENLRLHRIRNARAVVANPNSNRLAAVLAESVLNRVRVGRLPAVNQ